MGRAQQESFRIIESMLPIDQIDRTVKQQQKLQGFVSILVVSDSSKPGTHTISMFMQNRYQRRDLEKSNFTILQTDLDRWKGGCHLPQQKTESYVSFFHA